jgi:hypothetical protein
MLPKLNSNSAFIEVTNEIHGGKGWEFGVCLWSPVYSKSKSGKASKSWKILETVKEGDIIIHLLDSPLGYQFKGISKAEGRLHLVQHEPPVPGKWGGSSQYQRIELWGYSDFDKPVEVSRFFSVMGWQLRDIISANHKIGGRNARFFELKRNNKLEISEKYLSVLSDDIYNLIDQFLTIELGNNSIDIPNETLEITDNEPAYSDLPIPSRQQVVISRIIRDTKLARRIKMEYNWKCQICGSKIILSNGEAYAEGHHTMPLGRIHNGPDVEDNIIILCPTHHAEFDYGTIAIDPDTMKIIHADKNNPFQGKPLNYERKNLSKKYLQYHYENIYWG